MKGAWVLIGRATSRYWTGEDYTIDPTRALRFRTPEEATRWLQAHKHLRPWLRVAQLESEVSDEHK